MYLCSLSSLLALFYHHSDDYLTKSFVFQGTRPTKHGAPLCCAIGEDQQRQLHRDRSERVQTIEHFGEIFDDWRHLGADRNYSRTTCHHVPGEVPSRSASSLVRFARLGSHHRPSQDVPKGVLQHRTRTIPRYQDVHLALPLYAVLEYRLFSPLFLGG